LHSSPQEFAKVIDQDRKKWQAVVKSANVQAN
jgi:tripartite-type tricarboxylate transporter receptor subunit TctC